MITFSWQRRKEKERGEGGREGRGGEGKKEQAQDSVKNATSKEYSRE